MEDLIKTHQQAKQKQAQANAYLSDLQAREKEMRGKLAEIAASMRGAEALVSDALTSENLERELIAVEEVRKNECAVNDLLKNIGRAINDVKTKLPAMHNDIYLAETDIWAAQQERLINDVKAHPHVLQLIMKAYVAAWQAGYRWELAIFIREKIMGAGVHIEPEVLANLKDEMTKQIWPETDAQALQRREEDKDERTDGLMSGGINE